MDRRRHRTWLALVLVLVLATAGWIASGAAPSLGLDLQGGISAIYTPQVPEGVELDEEVLDETIDVIRARVDSLGVAEPEISRQGTDVLVQLPGLDDAARAQEIIGTTAQLTFRRVDAVLQPGTAFYTRFPACLEGASNGEGLDTAVVDGDTTDAPVDDPATDEGATDEPATDEGANDEPASDEGDQGAPALDDPQALARTFVAAQADEPTEAESPTDDGAATDDAATDEPATDDAATDEPATDAATDAELTDEEIAELLEQAQGEAAAILDGLELYRTGDEFPNDTPGVVCGPLDEAPTADPTTNDPLPFKYAVGAAALAGSNITDALPVLSGDWVVSVEFDGEGGDAFAAVTAELACERDQGLGGQFAIVLDNVVESAPTPSSNVACGVGIEGGSGIITVGGAGTEDNGQSEAQDLALVLRTGALPITLEPSTFETVSPTLGADSLRSGIIAGVLGLLLVAVYLIWRYRWLGVVAITCLSIFGLLMLGIVTLLGKVGFTLTLAGIAGIIVSIGITADSSILYFERIQDEVAAGRTVRTSVKRAFESAFRTNLAGNAVTFAAAVILYFLAVGPVRGFALTLGVATLLDLFLLYTFTRPVVGLMGASGRLLRRDTLRLRTYDDEGGAA